MARKRKKNVIRKFPDDWEIFTVKELDAKPTISSGHMHNLKYDDGKVRYWLSRMSVEDGETSAIYVEHLEDGRWVDVHQYGRPQRYEDMFGNPSKKKTSRKKNPSTKALKNSLLR